MYFDGSEHLTLPPLNFPTCTLIWTRTFIVFAKISSQYAYLDPLECTYAKNLHHLLPAMIGPPINFGSKGTSNVVQGAKFKVGVLRAASSASKDNGLRGTKSALLELF